MAKKDYYQVLGVEKSASSADLKKAYHKLAMKYHPDRNHDNKDAEEKFKEINEAYDVLKDEQKRAGYDRFGHAGTQQSGGGGHGGFNGDINDIFGDFFSDFMGGNSRRPRNPAVRGSDLKYELMISLEESFKGIDKNIVFNTQVACEGCRGSGSANNSSTSSCTSCNGMGRVRMQQGFISLEQTCSKCQGSGQMIKDPCKKCYGNGRFTQQQNLLISIPAGAGIGGNNKLRLVGKGEAGAKGGENGDLYIFINVKPYDIYKIDGANIHCKLPISFVTAALGGEIEVPIIEGEKVTLKIPPATQNGDQLRLKNKGMLKISSSNRGDMLAHIHIETPKNLTKRQRELLEEFDKDSQNGNDDSSFFDKMKSLWS